MAPLAPPRTAAERKRDTLHHLEHDIDAWIATAGNAAPYLIPLSFLWDGTALVLATPSQSITGRNLRATGTVRIGLGPTRDVVMIDGEVDIFEPGDVPTDIGDAFAAKHEWDPRADTPPYAFFVIRPIRIQAWREANELAGRDLMRDGKWLVS